MIKILANDGMDQTAVNQLLELGFDVDTTHYDGAELDEKIKQVDCIIIRSATKIRQPLIDVATKTKQLKVIIRAGVGIDNIDHVYAKAQGIEVRNTPAASSDAVAELALAHMFALARNLYHSNVTMREGKWLKKQYAGIEIAGKTLGLIGFGRISQSLAKKAIALGMAVQYFDIAPHPGIEYATAVTKEDLLKTSDFISLHIPFNKEFGPTIGTKEFAIMKQGMYLINTARGGVVDEVALLDALKDGTVAKAAIDVFAEEPTKNEALYTHEKVSLTPHIGAATKEAQKRIGTEIVTIIKEYFN